MYPEKYCPMCGTELNAGVCPNCGYRSPVPAPTEPFSAPIEPAPAPAEPVSTEPVSTGPAGTDPAAAQAQPPKKKILLPIIIIAAAAAAVLIILFVLKPFPLGPGEPADPIVGEWVLAGTEIDGQYYNEEQSRRGLDANGDIHLTANSDGSFTLRINTTDHTGTWSSVELDIEGIGYSYLLGGTGNYFAISENDMNTAGLYNQSIPGSYIFFVRAGTASSTSGAGTAGGLSSNQGSDANGHPTGK